MTDLYGNPERLQKDTPTITLQKNRKTKKLESDSIFILGLKVHGLMSKVAVAEALRSAADAVEESPVEKFTLEYRIEEAKGEIMSKQSQKWDGCENGTVTHVFQIGCIGAQATDIKADRKTRRGILEAHHMSLASGSEAATENPKCCDIGSNHSEAATKPIEEAKTT